MPEDSDGQSASQPVLTTQASTTVDTGIPNHLSSLVPTFNPSETDLDQYAQKVEMLTEIWPSSKLNELATRLILNSSGAAFQKLQLQRREVLTGTQKGLQRLVEILGGHWGKVNLQRKYEAAERALFRCQQKPDESNDSFLARADILWTDLIAQGMTLEELRAYVVLRGSSLTSEDRKRAVIESDSAGSGKLSLDKVSQAVRMLGSTFFQDYTGQKKMKGKVYDAYAMHTEDAIEQEPESTYHTCDEGSVAEEEWVEILAAEGDEDAILICDYEGTLQDVVQEDGALASAYNAYAEARRRLTDRFKNRGFWNGSNSSQKGKGRGGFSKGKGKGNSYKGNRKSLQQRILESHCRQCGKKGHWKAECPERPRQTGSSGPSAMPTMTTVTAQGDAAEFEVLPLEFMTLPEISSGTIDAPRPQVEILTVSLDQSCQNRYTRRMSHRQEVTHKGQVHPVRSEAVTERSCHDSLVKAVLSNNGSCDCKTPELVNFASHGTFGILDSGATKSVVGSALLPALLEGLHPDVRQRARRCSCNITFRFGNQGTLDSQHALVIPIGQLGLKIAIVPGQTPLLLSNTLMRTLQSQVDTERHQLRSRFLKNPIKLHLNPKGLFLIDINELVLASAKTGPTAAETFMNDTVEDSTSEPPSQKPNDAADPFDHTHPQGIHEPVDSREELALPYSEIPKTQPQLQSSAPELSTSVAAGNSQATDCNKVDHATDRCDHEPCRQTRPCAEVRNHVRTGRVLEDVSGSDEDGDSVLWTSTSRQHLRNSMEQSTVMAQMVPSHLRVIEQGRTQEADHLLHSDDRKNGTRDRDINPTDAYDPKGQDKAGSQGQELFDAGAQATGLASKPTELRRGRSGILATRDPELHPGRGHHGAAEPNGQCGECHHGDPATPETGPSGVDLSSCMHGHKKAGDLDQEFEADVHFSTCQQQFQKKFNKWVEIITTELNAVQSMIPPSQGKVLHILEVFCGPRSELALQANNMGFRGRRFGYEQGDLATKSGRIALFQTLCSLRPLSAWFSPTCGPWSAWSQFNEQRSLQSFDAIHEQREQNLYQLALGIVLLRYQFSQGRHMHWEQPKRSLMFSTPLLRELYEHTYETKFDLCTVGGLTDPVNHKPIQKGLCVRTTSITIYNTFHGRNCRHDHEHQVLEGNIRLKGQTISRTTYSEGYPRKFARQVARLLGKLSIVREPPKDYHQWCQAFVAEAKRAVRTSGAEPVAKRAKFQAANLIEPEQLSLKRRRLHEKTDESIQAPQTVCQRLIQEITEVAPRVGRKLIHEPKILQIAQDLFQDKKINCIMVCKGTDRKVAPPKELMAIEAPFRRVIAIQREDRKVLIEDEWEHWEHLPQCKLVSKFVPCYMNITVYAANHPDFPPPQPVIQPPEADQSQVSDRPCMTNPPCEDAQRGNQSEVTPNQMESNEPLSSQLDVHSSSQGERFRALSTETRQILIRMHKNLGHPSPQVFAQVLRQQGYSGDVIKGVEDMKCSTCQKHQHPKIQRPATLKHEMDFGDKISMDGLTWTNKGGKTFHVYHFLDHGTNYHTAVVAPNRSADRAMERLTAGWLSWAGPPNEVITDSATEFMSEEFQQMMKQFNIKCTNIPPGAHWQMGKVERHGDILQHMLSKYEEDHPIDTFVELQTALAHCTAAKNACSLRNGFPPEILVFGKGLRMPGSLASDEMLPAHSAAITENAHGIRFRQTLAMRESARKAFHDADNNMSLRRAALRRSRPDRGHYSPGEWVMYWRQSEVKQGWQGPAKVIQQDGTNTVFCVHMGNMVRVAPEHVRPVSAVEAQLLPLDQSPEHVLSRSITNTNPIDQSISTEATTIPPSNNAAPPTVNNPNPIIPTPIINTEQESNGEQPDQEPSVPSPSHPEQPETQIDGQQIPVPDLSDDDELVCDTLVCIDDDTDVFNVQDTHLGWRLELEIDHDKYDLQNTSCEEIILLATSQKKSRTEVKLAHLTDEELAEFDKAKMSEINNWLNTGTVSKALRSSLSPEQILRCRWIHTWKPLEDPSDRLKHGGKDRKAKSRLVVLGYLDPELETIPRDSPTLGRQSRMLILQLIASCQWTLQSFDVKTAFLQGRTQENRTLGIEPVPELREALKLKGNEVCRLEKSAYGLIDAPFLWFKELDATLKSLSFVPAPFDPCVYVFF